MKEIMDYMVRYWGFEDEHTIKVFCMIENGVNEDIIRAYIREIETYHKEEEEN